MIKAFTIALGLALAVPLALTTTARAEDNMRHDNAMHGDMHKDKMVHHERHHAMHEKDRGSMDREEAKVTAQLNQREAGDNRSH